MMKNKLIALFLFVAVAVNAAQIKDMSLDCGAKAIDQLLRQRPSQVPLYGKLKVVDCSIHYRNA